MSTLTDTTVNPEAALTQRTLLHLATAGSVDDGKSTLVGRLMYDSKAVLADQLEAVERVSHDKGLGTVDLALLTDGLRAEREQGITIDYGQVYSGQGDETILNQIGAQVVADGVDVIIPVATTAAQLMTVAAEGTGIPVVYAAVSDPEQADLLDLDYVTGMSDALNTQFILDMMLAQDPEVQTVGLLYSLSEPNSTKPIAEAKEYLDGKGITYKEYTANSVDEVIAAAGTLIADGVDAVFTPTDNKIMEAELAIAPELAEAGIPHYTGADSFVRNGAFTTCGVNYTDLGTQTADLAYQVASEGMDGMEDYYLVEGGIITVNTETARTLGADYSMFSDMGQVVEVATTED